MPTAQRVDDVLSPVELLARIEDLYHRLQALDTDSSTARYRRTPEYLSIEAQIRELAHAFWVLTE